MAKIPFPAGVMITRSDLEMVHPGQVVLRSIYGAGSQVLGRGPGHWRGRLEIAETDRCSDDQRRAVEAFLSRLRGALNTFEAPIERASSGSLEAGTKLTVSTAMLSSGVVTVTGAAEGLLTGDYVSIGDRLYQLTSDHQGSQFTVEAAGAAGGRRGRRLGERDVPGEDGGRGRRRRGLDARLRRAVGAGLD